MSFNIRHGRAPDRQHRWYKRRDLVFDLIRDQAPSVVGLQEANKVQLEEILDALPTFGAIADQPYGGRLGSYAAILFDRARLEPGPSGDFWLSSDPDGKRARAWDADVARICTWSVFGDRETDARFVLFNTHFDQRGQVARLESGRLLVARLALFSHLPRLVCGDLNAREDSPPLEVLRESGLTDTYRVVNAEGTDLTFHGFRGVKSIGRVDFILCDDRWNILDAHVIVDGTEGRFASDHYAITADLEVKAETRR
jgi:endonuclease/exonuclease/phosphatase family metal-dependent hydrolase